MTPEMFVERYKDCRVRLKQCGDVKEYLWGKTAIVLEVSEGYVSIYLDELPDHEGKFYHGDPKVRYFPPKVLEVIDNDPLPLPG